jgi:hypothetical protein
VTDQPRREEKPVVLGRCPNKIDVKVALGTIGHIHPHDYDKIPYSYTRVYNHAAFSLGHLRSHLAVASTVIPTYYHILVGCESRLTSAQSRFSVVLFNRHFPFTASLHEWRRTPTAPSYAVHIAFAKLRVLGALGGADRGNMT